MEVQKSNVALPKRLILAASIAALFCSLNAPAIAADMEDLIDKLREKGVLSEEEYQDALAETLVFRGPPPEIDGTSVRTSSR